VTAKGQRVGGKVNVRTRKLTDDEVRALQADIVARLEGLQHAYETSTGVDRDRHLLAAFVQWDTVHPLPTWLYDALIDQLKARIPQRQPSMPWRDWWRVTGAHEEARRKGQPISLREAARKVSQRIYGKEPEKYGGKVWKNYKTVAAQIKKMKLGVK
jgi:hypothetical protein